MNQLFDKSQLLSSFKLPLPHFLESYFLPPLYSLSPNYEIISELNSKRSKISLTPIFPVARIRNHGSWEVSYKLCYLITDAESFDDSADNWRYITLSGDQLADPKSMQKILANYGVMICTKKAADLADFFFHFIQVNQIPTVISHSKLGWNNGAFILPALKKGYLIEDSFTNQQLSQKGSHNVSMQLFNAVNQYPFARLICDANLAAPLMEPLEIRNFVLNLYARSAQGKTAALTLANSFWGSPRFMTNFNATGNSLEMAAASRNSLPTNVNELQTISSRDREWFCNNFIHRFTEATTRARMNKNLQQRPVIEYRNLMITTAEEPMAKDHSEQGIITRVLDIPAKTVIGQDGVDDSDLCSQIYSKTKSHFGHLGPMFINYLLDNDPEFESTRESYENFVEYIRHTRRDNILMAHVTYLALLATAHHLANKCFFCMTERESNADTMKFLNIFIPLMKTRNEILDSTRAKEYLEDFVNQYQNNFRDPSESDRVTQSFGFVKDGVVYIYKKVLKDALKGGGFIPEKIIRELEQDGAIDTDLRRLDSQGILRRVVSLEFITTFVPQDPNAPSNPEDPSDTSFEDINRRSNSSKAELLFEKDSRAMTEAERAWVETARGSAAKRAEEIEQRLDDLANADEIRVQKNREEVNKIIKARVEKRDAPFKKLGIDTEKSRGYIICVRDESKFKELQAQLPPEESNPLYNPMRAELIKAMLELACVECDLKYHEGEYEKLMFIKEREEYETRNLTPLREKKKGLEARIKEIEENLEVLNATEKELRNIDPLESSNIPDAADESPPEEDPF